MDRLKLLGKNKIGWTKVRVKSNKRERVVRVQEIKTKYKKYQIILVSIELVYIL